MQDAFSLIQVNWPEQPSNRITSWIEYDVARRVQHFILSPRGNPIGCNGFERSSIDACYLERLSVVLKWAPKIMAFAPSIMDYMNGISNGARKASIGIIAEQTELKEWCKVIGFNALETKCLAHLPFQAGFMELNLGNPANQIVHPDTRQTAARW